MVWSGRDAAERVYRGRAAAESVEATEKGAGLCLVGVVYPLTVPGCFIPAAGVCSALLWRASCAKGEAMDR